MAFSALFILFLVFLSHSFAAPTGLFSSQISNSASRFIPQRHATVVPPTLRTGTFVLRTTGAPMTTSATTTFTATEEEPGTKLCRQAHTPPSLCVVPPTFIKHGAEFCETRFCAPKYVEAEMCPVGKEYLSANAKCTEEKITRLIYKCDNRYTKTRTDPPGCRIGRPGCKEVQYCSCFKVSEVMTNQLKFTENITPECGPMYAEKEEKEEMS